MTILEQRFLECVPISLREVVHELKELNENIRRVSESLALSSNQKDNGTDTPE